MRNVKTPVLILYGENDVCVPLSQAIVFHRACVPPRLCTYTVEYISGRINIEVSLGFETLVLTEFNIPRHSIRGNFV